MILRRILGVLARATALFFGLYALANSSASLLDPSLAENLWWIDVRFLPVWLGSALQIASAVVLVAFAVRPRMGRWRRAVTAGAAFTLAALAALNAVSFYRLWDSGLFKPGVPAPLSLVLTVLFAGVGLVVLRGVAGPTRAFDLVGIAGTVVVLGVLFPLAQVAFFGTTDYRAPADAAVILGAKVHDDGRLSSSLGDRVLTGVELYREGEVPLLVMSGGVGANGIDEAEAMRAFAVAQGVPAEAVLCDSRGVNTDATVRETSAMLDARGADSVLVVSQFYHLPRIKLAYRAAGREVRTVPAMTRRPIVKTPLFVLREVPGFWVYWARALWRGAGGAV